MILLKQEMKGHPVIFRMWKEISPENWVTHGWMRIGLSSQIRAECWGSLPKNTDKNRIWAWTIRIIALMLHFHFIITLSLYRVFLLRSSKYFQRYYFSCRYSISQWEQRLLSTSFYTWVKASLEGWSKSSSLPSKVLTVSELSKKFSCPALPKERSSQYPSSKMLDGTPSTVDKYIWEILYIPLSWRVTICITLKPCSK